jgi:predicted HTH transcriptional regulator
MFDTTASLLQKIALGEDSFLELKALSCLGKAVTAPHRAGLADELAAFANARGGVCILEIEDETRRPIGVPAGCLDVAETFVRELCNDSIDPPLLATIEKVALPSSDGSSVVVIKVTVPQSLFVHRSPGGYLHRIGSSKREMSPDYLARLFQQRSQARLIRFDERRRAGS